MSTDTCRLCVDDEVEYWNLRYPVGVQVRYWPGVREGEGRTGTTRTKAWALGGHTAVVMVDGYAGAIALSHVRTTP